MLKLLNLVAFGFDPFSCDPKNLIINMLDHLRAENCRYPISFGWMDTTTHHVQYPSRGQPVRVG